MNKRLSHLQRRSVGLKGSLGLAHTKELPHLSGLLDCGALSAFQEVSIPQSFSRLIKGLEVMTATLCALLRQAPCIYTGLLA